jgi:hypothetical protein
MNDEMDARMKAARELAKLFRLERFVRKRHPKAITALGDRITSWTGSSRLRSCAVWRVG